MVRSRRAAARSTSRTSAGSSSIVTVTGPPFSACAIFSLRSAPLREQCDHLALGAAGDDHLRRREVDVHLAAYAKGGEVDARLHREADVGQEGAHVVRLEVVHVGALAVRLLADVVAGAVDEVVGVARLLDYLAGGVVHLPALDLTAAA